MSHTATILLADDDPGICTVVSQALHRKGYTVKTTHRGEELRRWVAEGAGDVAITDVLMPGTNGLDLLPEIHTLRPDLPVIVISAQNTFMTAVAASERGAFEYLPKPFDLNHLTAAVQKALELRRNTSSAPKEVFTEASLIGSSAAMQTLYRTLARMMGNDLTVLITGESGTGKELAARALHQLGKRKHKPFIAINMAAIPKELVESELFGHEKGAFTGAGTRKSGLFAQAEGGTLFLDEIGDMPMEAQTKLLRVLQQGEYTTVGGTTPLKADVRIICATHRDLEARVQTGEFRGDLYYRLNVVPIHIPPLRERKEDIYTLATHFLKKAQARGMPAKTLSQDAIAALQHYDWPGNVRELENLLYRLAALYAEPVISAEIITHETGQAKRGVGTPYAEGSLCDTIRQHLSSYFSAHTHGLPAPGLYDRILHAVERPLLEITLEAVGGNQIRAAEVLGINRNTLRKKLRELDIPAQRLRESKRS